MLGGQEPHHCRIASLSQPTCPANLCTHRPRHTTHPHTCRHIHRHAHTFTFTLRYSLVRAVFHTPQTQMHAAWLPGGWFLDESVHGIPAPEGTFILSFHRRGTDLQTVESAALFWVPATCQTMRHGPCPHGAHIGERGAFRTQRDACYDGPCTRHGGVVTEAEQGPRRWSVSVQLPLPHSGAHPLGSRCLWELAERE